MTPPLFNFSARYAILERCTMKIYRSVCTYIWNDDKFPYVGDDCQLVWFHIFTNPLSSPLGIFRASLAGLAEDKNRNGAWPLSRYKKAFTEALQQGFIEYDEKALLIAFPKYFSVDHKCNHPQSPNVVRSWGERYKELPESSLKVKCYQSLKALLKTFHEGFMKAFDIAFTDHMAKPTVNTDPDPNPNFLSSSVLNSMEVAKNKNQKKKELTDVEWLESLKGNTAYAHVNFPVELGKMDAWLSLKKNKHRKRTRRFVLNWLNKIEVAMAPGKALPPPPPPKIDPIALGLWRRQYGDPKQYGYE